MLATREACLKTDAIWTNNNAKNGINNSRRRESVSDNLPVSQDHSCNSRCRGDTSEGKQGCASARSWDTQFLTHNPDEEDDADGDDDKREARLIFQGTDAEAAE